MPGCAGFHTCFVQIPLILFPGYGMRGVVSANQLWHHVLTLDPIEHKHNTLSCEVLLNLDFRADPATVIDYPFMLIDVGPVKAGFYIPTLSVVSSGDMSGGRPFMVKGDTWLGYPNRGKWSGVEHPESPWACLRNTGTKVLAAYR